MARFERNYNFDSMHPAAKTSILGGIAGIIVFWITWYYIPYSYGYPMNDTREDNINCLIIAVSHGACFFVLFTMLEKFQEDQNPLTSGMPVLNRAFFLGWAYALGQFLVWKDLDRSFGFYCCVMAVFHYTEFLITALINPSTLTLDSFLLNHSKAYIIAACASWTEYALETYYFGWSSYWFIMYPGLIICIIGEVQRKGAMLTAGTNFTHIIQDKKVKGHVLVKDGVYSMCRHPSYAGWFWWSVGTQILLMNPFCFVAYVWASYSFFVDRIRYEEATLISFFGKDYIEYQKEVPRTGVPFIRGYYLGD